MEGSGITNSFDITPLLFAIAGFSLILLISGVYLLGGMFELFETDADGIKLALSGLILGGICFVVFLYQWVQQKQHYDLLYGSVMDTRKK